MSFDVAREALKLRAEAEAGPVGKRRSSFRLYKLLRQCYWLAQMCQLYPERVETIRALIGDRRTDGRNRTYVERGSTIFLLVARFVFHHDGASADRSNASRYGKAMEEAWRIGVREPLAFEQALREKGGVRAFMASRPTAERAHSTKTLCLDRPIEVGPGEVVELCLQRRKDGQFQVLKAARAPRAAS